jgi:hypothetical protein
MLGVVESDILADRIQLSLGSTRGVRAVSHSGHHAGDHRSQGKSPCYKENTTSSAAGFTGHFVRNQKTEADAGDSLSDSYGAADGKIFRKFIQGKL